MPRRIAAVKSCSAAQLNYKVDNVYVYSSFNDQINLRITLINILLNLSANFV